MEERIGFLDIETSNLDANFGFTLAYCIKELDNDNILYGTISKKDIDKYPPDKPDTDLIKCLIKDMLKFDRVVGHYSSRFDIPFIRTRALYCSVDFPEYGSLVQDDTWIWARKKLKLSSNRLDTIVLAILGKTNKNRIEFKYWIAGSRGDEKALQYILNHCKRDVEDLERVWKKINKFARHINSSI
jgi:uncharacterized protein YprB with RNaseH-like and TPR domain